MQLYLNARRKLLFLFLFPAILIDNAVVAQQQGNNARDFNKIKQVFQLAPDSITTSTYWYWISGNISEEGVIKDLEAMKSVGINRAYIGNIFLDDVPEGKVKMFSPEWWAVLKAALKRAGELDITIGLFNAPGWSQSGGPWVKSNHAMRYLSSSSIQVKGPTNKPITLREFRAQFQDVKVLAYRVPENFNQTINNNIVKLSTSTGHQHLDKLFDGDASTAVALKKDQEFSMTIETKKADTIRSLEIEIDHQPISFKGELQVEENGVFKTVKRFEVERSNPELHVGWAPYAPAIISVDAIATTTLRIHLSEVKKNGALTEIKLSGTAKLENYVEKSLAKMFPTPLPLGNAYRWPAQSNSPSGFTIEPDKIIDVSKFMNEEGVLNWQVPEGNWVIERFGMLPTGTENAPAPPEGRGLEVDKMNTTRIEEHFNAYVGDILQRIPANDRKSLKIVVADSYEMGGQNWTDNFDKEFKETFGYDPTPYLPALSGKIIGSSERSDRFLWDLRRLVADRVAYGYVGGLTKVSNANGMTTWLENYGHWGFPGEFLQYGGQADEIGGEFWAEGELGNIENRAASSAAHIYGKKKVFAESFTSAGQSFARYPDVLKKRADRFFTEGINSTVLHVYISQTDNFKGPGLTAWFGTEFNRRNTWFNDMGVFLQYLKRCGYLLQQGNYVADVAYFIGENTPKMTGEQTLALPPGYSFDFINAEVIRNRLRVVNSKLVLPDGLSYSVLVLPDEETIRPELLKHIQQLVEQGAILVGKKPSRSPSLQNFPDADKEVRNLSDRLWGAIDGSKIKMNKVGKGFVVDGISLQELFDYLKLKPDFKTSTDDSIQFIHRSFTDSEIYFLSNQGSTKVSTTADFRVTGKSPQLWDPVTGNCRQLPRFETSGAHTKVPIELNAGESVFVVFENPSRNKFSTAKNYPLPANETLLTGPWKVKFQPQDGTAYKESKWDSLMDWSKSAVDSIRYFSGTAIYSTEFSYTPTTTGGQLWLDLGEVFVIGQVKVNGKKMGSVWTKPYRVDITEALKPGKNTLEVKVVNNWKNKLIGESRLPEEQREVPVPRSFDSSSSLQSSGLLGPVRIYSLPRP